MSFKKIPLAAALASALSLAASVGHAVEIGGVNLAGSGFLTAAAGMILNGSDDVASAYKKPFYASDYAQGGVYEGNDRLLWKPDSKLGLQGTATFPGQRLSLTGQIVARGARDGKVNLEWLYAGYKLNDNFTLQAGRKRIPMFYYSDTQDIGLALPWVHLPSQLYGWEAVNYKGVNLSYQGQWGDWSSAVNLLAGSEAMKESGYWKIYRGRENRTDIKWQNIVGGDITLSKGWLETRFVYLQSKVRQKNVSGTWDGAQIEGLNSYGKDPLGLGTGSESDYGPTGRQKIYGLTFNVDYNNFLVRSETIFIDHNKEMGYKDHAFIVGVGYRFGKWTPMLTVSDYRSQAITSAGADSKAQEAMRTTSLVLRYDLTTSSDIKIQFDSQKDRSGPNYTLDGSGSVPGNRYGDARLLTISYDMVF
jgi:hypothetical protein